MRQSTAVNLVILGGGLTLFGVATSLNQANRQASACQKARAEGRGDTDPNCHHPDSGAPYHGSYGWSHGTYFTGGGRSDAASGSSAPGAISRGGFGGFGHGFGGGGE
jgi:hypothetical protein